MCGGWGGGGRTDFVRVFHRNISTTKSFNDCFRLFARVLSSGMWPQEGGTDGGGGGSEGGQGRRRSHLRVATGNPSQWVIFHAS